MMNHYLARQPILDAEGNLYAYELLFRDPESPKITDDRYATAKVLVNALNHGGLEQTIGSAYGFINIDHTLLLDDSVYSIPCDKFVLEILETVSIDQSIIERVKVLKNKGYHFALDDVNLAEGCLSKSKALVKLADIVKLDLPTIGHDQLDKFVVFCKENKIKILAEKVETREEFEQFKAIGCDYFQGYFFAKPAMIEHQRLDPAHVTIFGLVQQLSGNVDIDNIVKTFEQNAALSLQLLRFINSGSFTLRRTIKSIRQAVTLLGPRPLRNWLLLIVYANPSDKFHPRVNPLLNLAQTRANVMQQICRLLYADLCDNDMLDESAFIGLLSLAPTLFQTPLEALLHELNVDDGIARSLIAHEGQSGQLLQMATAVETDDFELIDTLLAPFAIERTAFREAILKAYELSSSFCDNLQIRG